MRFEGKTVLITGAGNGMGRETALMMAREGAKVVAMDIFQESLDSLKNKAADLDVAGTIEVYQGDLRNLDDIKGMLDFTIKKFGKLDILACVAGVIDSMAPVHATEDELWDQVMNINATSVFRTVREALPFLKDHEEQASIVFVSSVGGLHGSSAGAAYIASKHAIQGLMKNIAFTYSLNNIRCNAVAPGAISTNIQADFTKLFPDRPYFHPEAKGQLNRGLSAVRPQTGSPGDIASAIAFLASDEARYINGATLVVDNGWVCL